MGYRVYYDDYLLHDPVMTDYKLINPVWHSELSKVGSFSFTIPVTHPNYEFLEIMKPLIKIYLDGVLKFKGRIYKIDEDFYGNKTCSCEDCMGFLYDSLIAPFNFEGTAGEMFEQIIAWHNERVSTSQQIVMGSQDADNAVDRWQQNYQNAFDTIRQHVTNYQAGYMRLRYDSQERPVIDYLVNITDLSTQHCTYGVNLQDHIVDRNAEDFATAVIPLGGQMNEINPESTDVTRLTIADANGGLDYLINEDLANVYGIIYQKPSKTTHDMIHRAERLLEEGEKDLINAVVYKQTTEVTMADLGFVSDEQTPDVGTNIVIDSVPHGGQVSYLLRAMEVDLSDPAMATLTLGDEKESFLAKQQKTTQDLQNRVNHIENTYITEAQQIAETTVENNTTILTSAQEYVVQQLANYVTSDQFNTDLQSVITQLSVQEGNITASVQTIEQLQSSVASQFSNITNYLRFDGNGLTLGKSDSNIKLRLANDILYFFSGSDDSATTDNALAYFDSGRLYVKNVNTTESLTIGNFYFQPENNGSLSLVYNS